MILLTSLKAQMESKSSVKEGVPPMRLMILLLLIIIVRLPFLNMLIAILLASLYVMALNVLNFIGFSVSIFGCMNVVVLIMMKNLFSKTN